MVYAQTMALLYDRLMQHAPYDEWIRFTVEAFQQSGQDIKNVIDLGCGTGEITSRLAEEGFRMTGVDASTDMLTFAAYKANERNQAVQWINQDIQALNGRRDQLDAAVSYCDVMNYITTEKGIENVCKSVYDCLRPGGLFLFDVHSLFQAEVNYTGETFADVLDDAAYIWFCSSGETTGEMYHDLTFFIRDGQSYQRVDECHHQRAYPVHFFEEKLREAGFENLKITADFSLNDDYPDDESERIFFIAQKGSE